MPLRVNIAASAVLIAAFATGCAMTGRDDATREVRMTLPPRESDVLAALFRGASLPLAVDPFCVDIAGDTDTRTVGRYVARLLASQTRGRNNWVKIWASVERSSRWIGQVLMISEAGDEAFIWGIKFDVDPDGLVDPMSSRCFTSWTQ